MIENIKLNNNFNEIVDDNNLNDKDASSPEEKSDTPPHDATPDQKNDENDEDLDFDDLTRRFEALKKKK